MARFIILFLFFIPLFSSAYSEDILYDNLPGSFTSLVNSTDPQILTASSSLFTPFAGRYIRSIEWNTNYTAPLPMGIDELGATTTNKNYYNNKTYFYDSTEFPVDTCIPNGCHFRMYRGSATQSLAATSTDSRLTVQSGNTPQVRITLFPASSGSGGATTTLFVPVESYITQISCTNSATGSDCITQVSTSTIDETTNPITPANLIFLTLTFLIGFGLTYWLIMKLTH